MDLDGERGDCSAELVVLLVVADEALEVLADFETVLGVRRDRRSVLGADGLGVVDAEDEGILEDASFDGKGGSFWDRR